MNSFVGGWRERVEENSREKILENQLSLATTHFPKIIFTFSQS